MPLRETVARVGAVRYEGAVRRRAFVMGVAALVASSVVYANDLNCEPGVLRSLKANGSGGRVAARGSITLPANADLAVSGLHVRVAADPETDPAGHLLDVTIPGDAFTATKRGWQYVDREGALGGVRRLVVSRRRRGDLRIAVSARREAFPLPTDAEGARLVVTAGAACARTCPGRCKTKRRGRLACKRSTDTALCGLRSGCEPLGVGEDGTSRNCLLPYPSNFFTTADPDAATGRRIDYRSGTMPRNAGGVPVDPEPYRRLDGFSPGPIALVHVPTGVDLAASGVASAATTEASLAPSSPTLIVEADARGCVLVEHFGENDVSPTDGDGGAIAPPDQVFLLRPARRLVGGTRYVVALRNLVDAHGDPVAPPPAFRALRDGTPSGSAVVEARRGRTERLVEKLESDCGIDPASLVLAWDFTTASDESIQRYLLHMRDETFAELPGDVVPPFVVDEAGPDPDHPEICRLVKGRFTVPLWTTTNAPGAVLNLDPGTNLPVRNGVTDDVPFTAIVPCSLVSPVPEAGRPIVYGHGLLGSGAGEITAENLRRLASDFGFVIAATDWQGFSAADVPAIAGLVTDLGRFPRLSERLHQGVLNQLVLARLMRSPAGFAAHAAFRVGDAPLIDTSEVYYYGNSLGGIEGGVVMALSQEARRGVLGVAAANYSTLLHRSAAFAPFLAVLRAAYPDPVDRHVLLGLIQQLWDRSDPNGWQHRILPGLGPDTPPHRILLLMGTGDAAVANLGTEIMARSMGLPQLAPVLRSYRDVPEVDGPFDGSALVVSTFDVPEPPITNTPPVENGVHEAVRALTAIQAMIDGFLRPAGRIENLCTAGPTLACDPD